jgi:hypothetical protein
MLITDKKVYDINARTVYKLHFLKTATAKVNKTAAVKTYIKIHHESN